MDRAGVSKQVFPILEPPRLLRKQDILDICPVHGKKDAPGEDLQSAPLLALLTDHVGCEDASLQGGPGEEGGPHTGPAGGDVRLVEEGEGAGEDGMAGRQAEHSVTHRQYCPVLDRGDVGHEGLRVAIQTLQQSYTLIISAQRSKNLNLIKYVIIDN